MSEQEKKYTILFPQDGLNKDYFIDNSFRREVILHFVKNKIQTLNPPLILGVQGKAGEGKTSHIINICNQLKICVLLIHGSSLGSNFEGEPVNVINEAYLMASEYTKKNYDMVILIDDIDTSVASTNEDRKYTANSQLLNGVLMNIANNPHSIGGKKTEKIPIIFTGNNLMNLYAPLRRSGRMRIFTWTPDDELKIKIIEHMYKDLISKNESKEFLKIISRHIKQPISFFVDLKNNLFDDFIMDTISKHNTINITSIERSICTAQKQYSYLSKIKIDIDTLANNKLQDFNI